MAGLVPAIHVLSIQFREFDSAIEIAKIRQPVHRQSMRVFFTFKIDLHQVLREALPGTPDGGTIGKGFVDA